MLGLVYWGFVGVVGLFGLVVVATKSIITKPTNQTSVVVDILKEGPYCKMPTPSGTFVWEARSDGKCYIEDCKLCK